MMHAASISATPNDRITIVRQPSNLGGLVRDQLQAMSDEGYADIDIRWNSIVLSIEAQGAGGSLRRVFNCTGACVMEKIENHGSGVERYFDADGITLLSEEIFDESEDR